MVCVCECVGKFELCLERSGGGFIKIKLQAVKVTCLTRFHCEHCMIYIYIY